MAKIQATRRIQFCAGHRVHGHESKCATPHGHNYVAFFHAEANGLDDVGRVIDFSILKQKMGGWINDNWDHNFVVYCNDVLMINALAVAPKRKEPFLLVMNPTAENMAAYLLRTVAPKLMGGSGITITKVVLWETENCWASAEL